MDLKVKDSDLIQRIDYYSLEFNDGREFLLRIDKIGRGLVEGRINDPELQRYELMDIKTKQKLDLTIPINAEILNRALNDIYGPEEDNERWDEIDELFRS